MQKVFRYCIVWFVAIALISILTVADASESQAGPSLSVRKEDGAVVLAWPSNARESFAVLWRSNATDEARWVALTNRLPASASTTNTTFRDLRGIEATSSSTNIASLYHVLVIPDFWFDMKGVELNGGPKNLNEDFLPFHYGSKETDILKPEVELLVDGEPFHVGTTVDEDLQYVNFGTISKPHWIPAAGFWFDPADLTNGEHTLQITALIRLNRLVELGQSIEVSNEPVRIRVSEEKQTTNNWWCQRLGCGFVRKRPTEEDVRRRFVYGIESPLQNQIPARPLELFPALRPRNEQ